jgi:hypothetical protein
VDPLIGSFNVIQPLLARCALFGTFTTAGDGSGRSENMTASTTALHVTVSRGLATETLHRGGWPTAGGGPTLVGSARPATPLPSVPHHTRFLVRSASMARGVQFVTVVPRILRAAISAVNDDALHQPNTDDVGVLCFNISNQYINAKIIVNRISLHLACITCLASAPSRR